MMRVILGINLKKISKQSGKSVNHENQGSDRSSEDLRRFYPEGN